MKTLPLSFTRGGARQILIPGEAGKPCIEAMEAAIAGAQLHGVHNVKPAAISLTNASEAGTIYRPDEVAAYGELARRHDLGFHIDGARFANAVVSSGASPAELTWKAGVDALSFGATKNGALAAEVVVFFNQRYSAEFGYRRKRAGQLWSKHRFLAAQIDALLRDELWLRSAAHANAMAARLAQGLGQLPGVQIPWPTEANEVFPVFPPGVTESLLASGFVFYEWPVIPGMVRLVTSFQTREEEVDRFIRAAKAALKGAD